MEAVKALPEERDQRIAQIKADIEAGRYRIDSVKLSERILREI